MGIDFILTVLFTSEYNPLYTDLLLGTELRYKKSQHMISKWNVSAIY